MNKKAAFEPRAVQKYLDRSDFARQMRDAAKGGFGKVKEDLALWQCHPTADQRLLDAVLQVLQLVVNPTNSTNGTALRKVIGDLHLALGATEYESSARCAAADHQVLTELAKIDPGNQSIAYWVAIDMLRRWLGKEEKTAFTTSTKILTGIDPTSDGGLFLLTVELFEKKDGGPFCPDLFYLGLTEISETTRHSMQKAWQLSGLAGQFRGRWRIENVPDEDNLHGAKACYPQSFSGNSAEAATLCTLLAASGDPYCQGIGANRAEPLDQSVVLSAYVTDEQQADILDALATGETNGKDNASKDKSVLSYILGNVFSKSEKLSHAAHHGLTTVLFSQQEVDKRQREQDFANVSKIQREQDKPGHAGLRVYPTKTVLEAIDNLLLTNRFLRRYQQEVDTAWLKQWQPGTAEFKNSPEDGST